MKIPKRFRLLGQVIAVANSHEPFIEHTDAVAFASYRTSEIQMNPAVMAYKTPEQLQAAFMHELTHFVLYYSGPSYKGTKDHMHQDEEFVDLTANLFHQAFTTMEYE